MLGLFVNTLTANEKHSVLNRFNLTQPIQMYFQHFEKKEEFHSLCISEITDCERRG